MLKASCFFGTPKGHDALKKVAGSKFLAKVGDTLGIDGHRSIPTSIKLMFAKQILESIKKKESPKALHFFLVLPRGIEPLIPP